MGGLFSRLQQPRNIHYIKMQAAVQIFVVFVGLFHSGMLMAAPARTYLPQPAPPQVPVIPAPQTSTSVISVTPTITETVWDFHTTYLEVVVTRTQTQLFNVDVINTSWARTTVTVAQTATSRNIVAVPDIDSTTTVKSIHTAVDITTEVVPVRSTQVFLNTETVFETRTQTSQIYSQITHSKCVLEVITVPKLVKEEITETAPHFITNYFTQTLTVTTVVTVQAPTILVSNYY